MQAVGFGLGVSGSQERECSVVLKCIGRAEHHTHTHRERETHTQTHTQTYTHSHTHTQTHRHTHTDTYSHRHTHTHTLTHSHLYPVLRTQAKAQRRPVSTNESFEETMVDLNQATEDVLEDHAMESHT